MRQSGNEDKSPPSGERVGIVVKSFASGGAEKQAFLLAQNLTMGGCNATVIALGRPGLRARAAALQHEFPDVSTLVCLPRFSPLFFAFFRLFEVFLKPFQKAFSKLLGGTWAKFGNRLGCLVFALKRDAWWQKFFLLRVYTASPMALFSVIALRKIVSRHYISRLIIFGVENVPVGSITARKLGLPVVFSERNDVTAKPVSKTLRFVREAVYPEADIITANTEFAVRDLQQRYVSTRVLWLPNRRSFSDVFDEDRFTQGRDIAVISRLVPQKRVLAVIQAFVSLPLDDHDARLHVFGTGLELPNLEKAVRRHGLGGRVVFHGYKRASEIYDETKDLGFIIVNSEYEGSSNSLHEAVSHGLIPVVAESVREVREILRPSLHGVLITDGTPLGIAKTLRFLQSQNSDVQTLRLQIYSDFKKYWARCDDQLLASGPVIAGRYLTSPGGHN